MSKALELAAQMDEEPVRTVKQDIMHSGAAAELRRLDAENKTLKGELALWQNPNRSVIREMAALVAENKRLAAEVKTLRDALELAVRQNDCDMVMTGDELRKCYAALGETK